MKNPVKSSVVRCVGIIAATSLLLSSCSGGAGAGDEATPSASPSPTSTVNVPEGVSLTEPGAELGFGDTGTVIFEADQKRGTVLELTVDKIVKGSVKDFSSFIVNDKVRSSTPYYVSVKVRNVGEGNIGGAPIPLWGVDAENTLLPAATFTTSFNRCASEPLAKKFAADASVSTCLVYLAPNRGTLEAVSFRPTQEFNPITWTGDITTPKPEPKKTKKPANKKQDKKKD